MPLCLRVSKLSGQSALRILREMSLLDRGFKVSAVGGHLLLPVLRAPSSAEMVILERLDPEADLLEAEAPRSVSRPSLVDLLSDSLPTHLLALVPRSIDHVGDIAVVELAPELWKHRNLVGEAILTVDRRTKTVLAKKGAVSGIYRLREYELVAGDPRTVTAHRENGCIFHLDLAKVYFTPRLSFEHRRVAGEVSEGETVADLFTGVGPYAIQMAKRLRDILVYAVDVNPTAVEYLKKNIAANKVWGKVIPIEGDARDAVKGGLAGKADRVIMNLPSQSTAFLNTACLTLKPRGGVIHHYAFTTPDESFEAVKASAVNAIGLAGRNVRAVLTNRILRCVAPREYLVALDLAVE